jgi:hypothetical protein
MTITDVGIGLYNIDSFFDVTYEVEFEGCPASQIEDYMGTTTDTERWEIVQPCNAPGTVSKMYNFTNLQSSDKSSKITASLPPDCPYDAQMEIINGFPPNTTVQLDATLTDFFCNTETACTWPVSPGNCEIPGGSLGGTIVCFEAALYIDVTGTGELEGFNRHLAVPVEVEYHTAPRSAGLPYQTFQTEMYKLTGELFGDPDFCTFRVRAGTYYGLPGPGSMTLTDIGNGTLDVESFFDIMYEVEFEGCPGSQLEDYNGTTPGAERWEMVEPCNTSGIAPYDYSRPGELLWMKHFLPGEYTWSVYASGLEEGWYNPNTGLYEPSGDHVCYRYVFPLELGEFIQEGSPESPVVYWIDVQTNTDVVGYPGAFFGWKTAMTHWNDDGTWAEGEDNFQTLPDWMELRYPTGHPYAGESVDMAFAIFGAPPCDCEPGECDGSPPLDILDIVHMIDYKFKECPPGAGLGTCPPPTPYAVCSGDTDCNCIVDILDIVLMIDYKFKECPPGAGFGTCPPPCSCEEWVTQCGYPIYKK